jgi:hypothetical protein
LSGDDFIDVVSDDFTVVSRFDEMLNVFKKALA